MTNDGSNAKRRTYDLEKRTATFGVCVIRFLQSVPESTTVKPLMRQLVRSATSIGANYMEADEAETKKDFIHKIKLCKKEAKETQHWLHMIAEAVPRKKDDCRKLWKEANELVRIFAAIVR